MKQIFFWKEDNQYAVFSNFYPHPVTVDGRTWPTSEHYYQAMKTPYLADQEIVRALATPAEAKKMGRRLKCREDWQDVKYGIMLQVLREKFSLEPLRSLLTGTGDAEIYEDSPYDRIWGTGQLRGVGTGQNLLGKALMQVRSELRG